VKPTLVLGLGSTLAGDDAIGRHLAERLSARADRLPDTEVAEAGTDLLRLADLLRGRGRVFLLDALLDDGPCGRVLAFDDLDELDDRPGSVHHLSPVHALRLLRAVHPELRDVPVTFLCVTVRNVRIQHGLSADLEMRLDEIEEELVRRIRRA
jgi:hydrogenase maturation protease